MTACQQACPTQAIVFGNLNDKTRRCRKLAEEPAGLLDVLEELEHAAAHDVPGEAAQPVGRGKGKRKDRRKRTRRVAEPRRTLRDTDQS